MVLQFYEDINKSCCRENLCSSVLHEVLGLREYSKTPIAPYHFFALSAILATFYKDLARCP